MHVASHQITTSQQRWDNLQFIHDGDRYGLEDGQVILASDGYPGITIYPGTWDGNDLPPGNFGALQIGAELGTRVLTKPKVPSACEMRGDSRQ